MENSSSRRDYSPDRGQISHDYIIATVLERALPMLEDRFRRRIVPPPSRPIAMSRQRTGATDVFKEMYASDFDDSDDFEKHPDPRFGIRRNRPPALKHIPKVTDRRRHRPSAQNCPMDEPSDLDPDVQVKDFAVGGSPGPNQSREKSMKHSNGREGESPWRGRSLSRSNIRRQIYKNLLQDGNEKYYTREPVRDQDETRSPSPPLGRDQPRPAELQQRRASEHRKTEESLTRRQSGQNTGWNDITKPTCSISIVCYRTGATGSKMQQFQLHVISRAPTEDQIQSIIDRDKDKSYLRTD